MCIVKQCIDTYHNLECESRFSFDITNTVDKNNQMLTIYIFRFEYFQIKFHLQFVVTIVHNEDYLRTGFDVNRPKQLISQ